MNRRSLAALSAGVVFGIFLVFMVEMSQVTPPVGFSLFVIQSISGEKIGYIIKATFPFFLIMILILQNHLFIRVICPATVITAI